MSMDFKTSTMPQVGISIKTRNCRKDNGLRRKLFIQMMHAHEHRVYNNYVKHSLPRWSEL
jgi:hypothetical protein